MNTSLVAIYLVLQLLFLKNIRGVPTCQYVGRQRSDLVCTSTDGVDYILERGLVSDSNRTKSITLRGCRISDMELESFEDLFYLESMDLSQNNLTTLKLGVLDGNDQVTYLNLSRNSIYSFPLGVFDEKPNLSVLDLSFNILTNPELGIFDELKKLTHVDLSWNSMAGVGFNAYIFDRSPLIKHLDLSGNNMEYAPNNMLHALKMLERLNLNRCFLKEVPEFVKLNNLKSIKQLHLSKNFISKLESETFANLENLETLDLAENVIEDIDEITFKNLKKLKSIVLRNNKLISLPDSLFKDMQQLGNLDLAFNSISTVPLNAFRGTALKNLNLSNNRFTYLMDNFCLELRNSGVQLKKFFFNQNPWQCSCLRDVLNEVRTFEIEYNGAHYDGEHPVCVSIQEITCKRHAQFNDEFTAIYDNNLGLVN